MDTQAWDIEARSYLQRLGAAEYAEHMASKSRKKLKYRPTEYHSTLIEFLNKGDEEAFKAEKMLRGAHSALGH